MIRRFGDTPERGRNYVRRAGAFAILPLDGHLLLTHQEAPEPEIQLPGGGIDPGESAVAALHREVFEETGWRISNPRRFGVFRRFVYMPEYDLWAEKICTIFVARPTLCLGPPSETGHSALWQTPGDAAQSVANPGDRYFTARFANMY